MSGNPGAKPDPNAPEPDAQSTKAATPEKKVEVKEFKAETKLEHKESLIKETKPEKFEQKETKPEKVEHKETKPEKFEQKEFKNEGKVEHKESLIKETKLEKFEQLEVKQIVEGTPDPTHGVDPAALHARLTAVENAVAELRHFINPTDRPDLSKGALGNEPDAPSS